MRAPLRQAVLWLVALWLGCSPLAGAQNQSTPDDERIRIEAELVRASGLARARLLYELTELDRSSFPEAALTAARDALALVEPLTSHEARELRSLLLANSAWSYGIRGDYARALQDAEQGLALARQFGSQRAEARNLNALGVLSRNLGDLDAALTYFQQTLTLEEALGNQPRKCATLNNLGLLFLDLARTEDAFTMLREAERLAREIGDEKLQALARVSLAEAYIQAQENQQALDWLQHAGEIASQRQVPVFQATIQHNRGLALAGLGQLAAARAALEQALQRRESIGHEAGECETRNELGRLAIRAGDFREAHQQITAAEAICKRIGDHTQLKDVLDSKVLLLESQRDFAGALAASREREALSRQMFSERAALRIGQFQNKLSLAQRENQIALLTRENEIQQLRVRQQRQALFASAIGALLLLIIALLVFFRLRGRRQMAEAAAASRSRFLAQMSHEIRTPMTGVIGVSELLQDTPLNNEQRELLQTIRQSSEALLGLVNDILDLSKLDAGRLQLHSQAFDLRQLLESVLDVFALQAEQKQLQLLYSLPLSAPVQVQGDPLRLRQILLNLLGNAIKFTEQGAVQLRAHWQDTETGERQLALVIEDTGIGISAELQAHIFEPFAQAHGGSAAPNGTGLGLTISQQLARLMGGEISMHSTVGSGSRFTVTVRLQVLETEVPALASLNVPALFGWQLPPALNEHVQQLLRQLDVRYVEVGNAGFDAVIAANPALLAIPANALTDHQLTTLRARLPQCRLLLLAGPQARRRAHEKQLPVDAIVPLPIRPAELLAALIAPAAESVATGPVATEPGASGTGNPAPGTATTDAGTDAKPQTAGVAATTSTIVTATSAAAPAQKHALIVDDNEINRRVAQKLLERFGFQVTALDGGRAAVTLLQQRHYDIVFMDCQMPDLDGFDATRQIRQNEYAGRRQLIVAMTAHALKGDREHCLNAGMDDYLAKPIKFDTLASLLSRWGLHDSAANSA